jgi:hypothetical protein
MTVDERMNEIYGYRHYTKTDWDRFMALRPLSIDYRVYEHLKAMQTEIDKPPELL